MPAEMVLNDVAAPESVKVRSPVPDITMSAVPPNTRLPDPFRSIPPPFAVTVKPRSIVTAPPVYWSVPPSRTMLAGSAVAWPMPLAVPPLASAPTESTPPEIRVTPVKVLAAFPSTSVPAPTFVSPVLPGVVNTPSVIVPLNVVLAPLAPTT